MARATRRWPGWVVPSPSSAWAKSCSTHSNSSAPAVGLPAIRSYIAWLECIPRQELAPLDNPRHRYWLGEANGQRVFFCYEPERITCLDMDLLNELIQTPGPTLFYADQLALGEELMRRHNLRFKKILAISPGFKESPQWN